MPLKGTCTTSIAALLFKISAAKCVPLPTPAEEKLMCPDHEDVLRRAVCVTATRSVISYGSLG